MFIFTAKLNRKRAIIAVISLAVILCAIILLAGLRDRKKTEPSSNSYSTTSIKTNEDRVKYLESFGWKVKAQPKEEQEVVIPREFTKVYANYASLQKKQGFELANYGGMEAKRYTYEILNYPSGEKGVVADIIVYRNTIIAGDVQSTALNGFMHGLNENIKPSSKEDKTKSGS
jgi:hypothetical protein